MSLVRVCIDNCWNIEEKHVELLRQIWPNCPDKPTYSHSFEDVFMDIDDVPDFVSEISYLKIKPIKKIKVFNKTPVPDFNGDRVVVKEFLQTVNQVVMPAFDLLNYVEIKVEQDQCTEVISQSMRDGWRIIAVLPQPDQRRPDYIMVRK